MCYHSSKSYSVEDLYEYYGITSKYAFDKWQRYYHENGFDHNLSPVLVNNDGLDYGNMSWGLIPWYTKSMEEAVMISNKTLNCISEEMFDKPSFRDSLKDGKRCLIPMTGFFEWKWQDSKGKEKTPHYISLKSQKIFSVAGIWSSWKNKNDDITAFTYSVLTTKANKLMEEIHNSKKRMPVIIPREFEKDWLNPSLTKDDVLALCRPYDDSKMDAYTISKRITSRKEVSNVPEVMEKFEYERTTLF
jgi:putative SOS response-associated peptidase YedK